MPDSAGSTCRAFCDPPSSADCREVDVSLAGQTCLRQQATGSPVRSGRISCARTTAPPSARASHSRSKAPDRRPDREDQPAPPSGRTVRRSPAPTPARSARSRRPEGPRPVGSRRRSSMTASDTTRNAEERAGIGGVGELSPPGRRPHRRSRRRRLPESRHTASGSADTHLARDVGSSPSRTSRRSASGRRSSSG